MSTQLIGFSIGGICKRILVAPACMIWPQNLPTAAIFNTLHTQETTGTWAHGGIPRECFFIYVLIGYFFYSQFLSSVPALVISHHSHQLRLLAILPLHSALLLFVGVLDLPQQCQDQSVIRCYARPWYGSLNLRLGSNHCLQ
jgi:OPT oligopeptide transporter protein